MNQKAKILLVDDEELNLDILEEILGDEYFLSFASDGQKALEKLQEQQPDLILLDVMMPGLTGWEVLKIIKKDPVLKYVPVIMQTALASDNDFKKGLSLGAYYYVSKPIRIDTIKPLVKAAIRESQELQLLRLNLQKADDALVLTKEWKLDFRTREEATSVAKLLARACPNPGKHLVGLLELLLNAVEHGIAGIGYQQKTELIKKDIFSQELSKKLNQPELQDKYATVHFVQTTDKITIKVKDPGVGFDWHGFLEFNIERATDTHGRGIAIAKTVCFDELEYIGAGNHVNATIRK